MIHWEIPAPAGSGDVGNGHVGLATIDRPERRNALSAEMCVALGTHLADNPSLRAVVITGAGGTFCSGADLGVRFSNPSGADDDAGDGPSHGGDVFRPSFEAFLDAVVAYPAPVITAIEGHGLGAGLQLAVASDLRVAAPDAKLGIPAGKLGVHLSAANIARLAQVVGQGVARDILLGSRVLSGEEALACGLVHRVDEDPLAAALAWADDIAKLAPLTLAGHKRALNLVATAPYDSEALAEVDELERRAFDSEDLREGMAAFSEKRPPDFRGR